MTIDFAPVGPGTVPGPVLPPGPADAAASAADAALFQDLFDAQILFDALLMASDDAAPDGNGGATGMPGLPFVAPGSSDEDPDAARAGRPGRGRERPGAADHAAAVEAALWWVPPSQNFLPALAAGAADTPIDGGDIADAPSPISGAESNAAEVMPASVSDAAANSSLADAPVAAAAADQGPASAPAPGSATDQDGIERGAHAAPPLDEQVGVPPAFAALAERVRSAAAAGSQAMNRQGSRPAAAPDMPAAAVQGRPAAAAESHDVESGASRSTGSARRATPASHQQIAAAGTGRSETHEPLHQLLEDLVASRTTAAEHPSIAEHRTAERVPAQPDAAAAPLSPAAAERFGVQDIVPHHAVKHAFAAQDGSFQPSQDHGHEQRPGGDSAGRTAAVSRGAAVPVATLFHAALSAVEATEAPAPPAPPIPNEEAVAHSIVQSMRMQYREGIGTAVLQLDPSFLGGLKISLHVAEGHVNATMHADNASVRAWLESNEATLRQGLAEHGLHLERLVVAGEEPQNQWTPPDDRRRRQGSEAAPSRKRAAREEDAGTFEVIV